MDTESKKRCRTCKETKPVAEFFRMRAAKDGRNGRCKVCENAYSQNVHKQSPSRRNGRRHRYRLRSRYGITELEYANILAQQAGVCAICSQPEKQARSMRLAVDHDHDTENIRGLLCNACNRGLGFFVSDPSRLRAAAVYLERPWSFVRVELPRVWRHPKRKLSAIDVQEIRGMLSDGVPVGRIARKFEVAHLTIRKITWGETYRPEVAAACCVDG